MARILITSGPTRQYLDPVRYLTNASSGRMGRALAEAALAAGHEVIVVSGPVAVDYPPQARVLPVISTEELLETCQREFPNCDGVIGAAAPCDYVMALLGATKKPGQWLVGFALETDDQRFRALVKLEKKSCDLIVLNGPLAMDSLSNQVEVLDASGQVIAAIEGSKEEVANGILGVIGERLIS
ncbi:MAG: phosphopantothenoylcysteine decarboxylase [Planctomycetales bacterium]|nr:phosphopantothenoylcysteine decarboxylase [Planctomycetales bacterium]